MAEPLNATFFAFRKRERSGVLLRATIAFAVLAIGAGALFTWLNWQAFLDYMNWAVTLSERADEVDPSNPFAMMPPQSVMALFPAYILFLVVYYLLLASYESACLKWMIRGETGGLFGLALDADTLRVYFTYWMWLVLLIAAYLVMAIVGFGLIAGLAAGAGGDLETFGAAGGLSVVAIVVLLLVLLVYFSVRFAPAAATSIAKRRFAFFDAWTVTKGRFWALFGAFVLLFLMYCVGVIIVSTGVTFAIGAGIFAQVQSGAEPASPQEAIAAFATPAVIVPVALMYAILIVGAFLFYLSLFGINARAAQAALAEGRIQAAT